MTTITIERELLEQALAALSAPNHCVFSEPPICVDIRVALSAPATAPDEQLRKDAERFVWYESNSEKVLNIGPCWYSRNGYGLPMKRRKGFREAIDAAMKETP